MPARRPAVVTVVGILQIIFGSLGLLGGLFSLIMLAGVQDAMNKMMPKAAGQPDPVEMQRQMEQNIAGFKEFQWIETGSNLVIGLLMLMGGIGLLKLRGWGRGLTITYCFLSLLSNIGKLAYTIMAVFPGIEKVLPAMLPPNANQQAREVFKMAMMFGQVFAVVLALVAIGYIIFVLVVMFRGSVVQAFQQAASGEAVGGPVDDLGDHRPYADDDDDEWRPQR